MSEKKTDRRTLRTRKGSKKLAPMIIAAIVTIAGAATLLTGCGTNVPASSAPAANVAVSR